MNLISFEDVAKNNGKNGSKVWVILQRNVYDLTDYIREVCGFFFFSKWNFFQKFNFPFSKEEFFVF